MSKWVISDVCACTIFNSLPATGHLSEEYKKNNRTEQMSSHPNWEQTQEEAAAYADLQIFPSWLVLGSFNTFPAAQQ